MFKHLPVIAAIWPATAGLWFIHPNSATATVAGVSVAAAFAEHKLRQLNAARQERKAAKAAKGQAPQVEAPEATYPAPYVLPAAAPHVVDHTGRVVQRRAV